MSEGILMVSAVGRPRRIVGIDSGRSTRIERLYFSLGREMAKVKRDFVDLVATRGGGGRDGHTFCFRHRV